MALSWAECHLFLCIFLSSWDVRACSPRGALEPRQSLAPSLAVWRALFPALLPVRLFSPSFLEPRKWAQGCVQSQGAGQWQSPAFQPCSLALELSFLNAVTSCFLGGVAGRTRGARGHRVLLVTVFCFLFFCWGRVVSGSVPWGLALRWTSVGCLQGHPLEIWGVKEAGLDQKWGGLS